MTSPQAPKRVIKRYSNRKLYDTRDSRYVTLQQIGEMVRSGQEVQIIDNKTKEDKTEVTLALILSEDLKSAPRSVPLATLRDLIQERGEKILTQLREGPIGRLLPQDSEPEPDSTETPASEAEHASARKKLSELVEGWQHAVDERIKASLPVFPPIRELQRQVKTLEERVRDLEKARDQARPE